MIAIDDTELFDLCTYLSTASYIYYPIATDYFSDLFKTGCRPTELIEVDRWLYNDPSDILLTPCKGNSTRLFTALDLSPGFITAIINQVEPYQALSIRQLTSVLKRILPVAQIQTIDKSAIDYMFRYNFVKTLSNNGMSDTDIAAVMGWSTPLMSASYRTTQLYSSTQLPPYLYDLLIDDAANLLVDDSGNYIQAVTI